MDRWYLNLLDEVSAGGRSFRQHTVMGKLTEGASEGESEVISA